MDNLPAGWAEGAYGYLNNEGTAVIYRVPVAMWRLDALEPKGFWYRVGIFDTLEAAVVAAELLYG